MKLPQYGTTGVGTPSWCAPIFLWDDDDTTWDILTFSRNILYCTNSFDILKYLFYIAILPGAIVVWTKKMLHKH